MTYINGVNLLPGTGEFTYDTLAHMGRRVTEPAAVPINGYASGATAGSYAGEDTDFTRSIDALQAEFPACTTVALIVSWFFDSRTAGTCKIYPSTTYIGGNFAYWTGSAWAPDAWKVSGLTEASVGLIPISSNGPSFSYGGTPSDPSIVRAILDLKARGLRVVFYPFLLGDIPGDFPWRGRITYSPDGSLPDVSSGAAAAVAAFLGSAAIGDFTQDLVNQTVNYLGGGSLDFTYRRMILHYAHLCVVAGGVDLFLIGSELRGLETIRGTAWTLSGGGPPATWDYPFVDGLIALADDVRAIFDAASLTKNLTTKKNLISYAGDWSVWMGTRHDDANPATGVSNGALWPHLDKLWSHTNIDLVCIDNYMPLSDWTTGAGGLDVLNWSEPRYSGTWPPDETQMNGLGLTGAPVIQSKDYFKANIEGGEKFFWFYFDSDNAGRGFDPLGSGAQVSRPEGDRLSQSRVRFYPDHEILANKQIRWWWKHTHKAMYDTGRGAGLVPQGNATGWTAQAKSIAFSEYGFPSCDKATNQPNVFFDPKSSESFTPFWSVWKPAFGGSYLPQEDTTIVPLALQAIHEYWFVDGNNETSGGGIVMLDQAFTSVWAWDARPFPTFPRRGGVWGDAPNWPSGNWIQGKGPYFPPTEPDTPPGPGTYPAFPVLAGQGWSVRYTPTNVTLHAEHISGREARAARTSAALLEVELTYDVLRMAPDGAELETLAGFYADRVGADAPFTIAVPAALGFGSTIVARFADDHLDLEEFMSRLWRGEAVKVMQVRGE
jgi:hypothetical protein